MILINKDDAFAIVDAISKAKEVVFCKDCKWWNREEKECWITSFWTDEEEPTQKPIYADDFCSRGEKR